jgi:ABC-type transporter Mla subunit MlaD
MNLRRDETLTGLLVLVTFAVVMGAVMALSAPGVFHPQKTYYVFFDNAGGIEPGTYVLLAGRHVGQVVDLQSPVPVGQRPDGHKNLEALIKVRVTMEARIYTTVSVRMQPYGMLGQVMIDFVSGDETTGVATSGTRFVGERVAGLGDAAEQATQRLVELKATIANLNGLTGTGGDLRTSAANLRDFTDTIRRQPWRLLWPSTKKFPKDAAAGRGAPADKKPDSDAR